MTRVLQIVQHLRPGGIETMALDLHRFHRDRGDESRILALEGDLDSALRHWPRLEAERDRLVFLDKANGFSPRLVLGLARRLVQMQIDVLHTHHVGPLFYGGLAALLARPATHIHTEHDAWHLEDPRRRRLQGWLLKLTRPILVADAESVAASLRRLLDPARLSVIRNGIDSDRFVPGDATAARRALGLPVDRVLLGCSGRLEKIKGQQTLIEALGGLPEEVHLALAGIGSNEAQLRALSDALGLAGRVHFLGRIDDMPRFYQALDCFCLPSYREGMPLAPLEAQACGIPAIVSDTGGARESLCPSSGNLVPPGCRESLIDAIGAVLARGPGESPRSFIQRECSIERMAGAYARLHAAAR